ncbi:hypothetical protein L1049_019830 [Liquidambar formosana]|uniref:Protein kinase domain-containing protein n=1 Tax=Liquidambar formosana TaxID=63359 RepID=A0AAP0X385_LIQFO
MCGFWLECIDEATEQGIGRIDQSTLNKSQSQLKKAKVAQSTISQPSTSGPSGWFECRYSTGSYTYYERYNMGPEIVFVHLLAFMPMSHPIHCPVTGDVIWNCVSIESGESRYLTEYTELGFLGQGGYGCVVKGLNKLDGVTYAVKKISLRETNWPFNEVKKIWKFVSC